MDKITFLQTLKKIFEQLKKDGIVTQEEIDNGFKIPIEWLSGNEGISRESITRALNKLFENRFLREPGTLVYTENDGVPYLEYKRENGTIIIVDQYEIQLNKNRKDYGESLRVFLSKEFNKKILSAKKYLTRCELEDFIMKRTKISDKKERRDIATALTGRMFDDSKEGIELTQTIPEGLKKMATDFGEYYTYLHNIDQLSISNDQREDMVCPWHHARTIVKQRSDRGGNDCRGEAYNETPQRVSEIHPFSERDKIYMNYGPIRVVTYDAISQEGAEIPCAFTLYIYENPAEREGYLGIVEPYEGNKTTRVFFKTKDEIDSLIKKGKEEVEVFEDLGEEYICMSSQEFDSANRTTTLRHRGKLEDFKIRVGSILGREKADTVGKREYYKKIQKKLGILDCKKIVDGVTSIGVNNARLAMGLVSEQELEEVGPNEQ